MDRGRPVGGGSDHMGYPVTHKHCTELTPHNQHPFGEIKICPFYRLSGNLIILASTVATHQYTCTLIVTVAGLQSQWSGQVYTASSL